MTAVVCNFYIFLYYITGKSKEAEKFMLNHGKMLKLLFFYLKPRIRGLKPYLINTVLLF